MGTGCRVVLAALLLTGMTGAGSRRDEVEMVAVPAGEFVMGADDSEADDDERPVARVFGDLGFRCAASAAPQATR